MTVLECEKKVFLGVFVPLIQEVEDAKVVAVRHLMGFRECLQCREVCCVLDTSDDVLT